MSLKLSAYALKVLAPGLFIVAIMGVFRGYFQGMGTMMPTCVAGLLEQVVSFGFSLILGNVFHRYGIKIAALLQEENYIYAYSAIGIVLGMMSGALFSLFFLVLLYFVYQRTFQKNCIKDPTKNLETQGELTLQFIAYLVPNALPALLLFLGVWMFLGIG